MRYSKNWALVFLGICIGCGAGATMPASIASTQGGKWMCFSFRSQGTSQDGFAMKMTGTLNAAAPNSPVGAVVVMGNYFCAKN